MIVASIGMLPPTPSPTRAQMKQRAPKLLGAAKIRPKTLARRQVMLKHHLRPMMSTRSPQVKAPTVRPAENAVKISPIRASATPSSCYRDDC